MERASFSRARSCFSRCRSLRTWPLTSRHISWQPPLSYRQLITALGSVPRLVRCSFLAHASSVYAIKPWECPTVGSVEIVHWNELCRAGPNTSQEQAWTKQQLRSSRSLLAVCAAATQTSVLRLGRCYTTRPLTSLRNL